MLKKSAAKAIALCISLGFLTACDPLMSQNPADSFLDKKFPKQLEWMRSQLREISLRDQEVIVHRAEADQNRKDLLKVAVIDSGVDIAHPDLLGQINFRVHDHKIVGAGYDVMSGGAFGSHVLIDPSLFAFGAKGLRDGKIVDSVESPLALLQSINNRFRDLVMAGIAADPLLRESLFSQLQRDSFTVLGLADIRTEESDYKNQYQEMKDAGHLVSKESLQKPISKDRVLVSRLVSEGWTEMGKKQIPEALEFISSVEHGDLFIQAVSSAYKALDKEFNFSKRLENYNVFTKTMMQKDPTDELSRVPKSLLEDMLFVVKGVDAYDPISNLEQVFRARASYRGLTFEQAFEKYFNDRTQKLEAYIADTKVKPELRKYFVKHKAELGRLKSMINNLVALKNNPEEYQKMRSQIRRLVYRTRHPYLAKETLDNSHATHVAGTIALQNPLIRIEPIRVNTQTVAISKERQKELINDILNRFTDYKTTPFYEPLKSVISKEYGGLRISEGSIDAKIKKYLEKNPLNALFILDVLKAVEHAGAEKIKLANVSLGTMFKKNFKLDQKEASFVEDLFSEFARYQIGKTIQEKAPGTLFVIATGNDGAWVDGVAKTAFPVSITSSRLLRLSKEKGLVASPNNTTKNVLGVASVNPNGTFTEFTNLLIDPNIPQVFSTGEEIMSTVPGKSMDAANEVVGKMIRPFELVLLKMGIADSQSVESQPMDDRMEASKESLFYSDVSMEIEKSLTTLVHAELPVVRARMSGTSMATPTVTGVIANYLIEKMKREGVLGADIYNHPQFSPEKIVQEIMTIAKINEISPMITVRMLVDGIKTWKASKSEALQKQKVARILSPRCEALFSW